MSSRTSFARCSNFLLSQKRSDTTVIADRVSPGGLGMSGSGWSRQGRTNGTSGSFSSACLVLRILVWVAMSKRRRMRIDVICELFQTLLTVEVRARSTDGSWVGVYIVCKLLQAFLTVGWRARSILRPMESG